MQDPNNHLQCRKSHLLGYAASRSPWTDLLMYGALGSTAAVYRHCYLRGGGRWAFDTPYVNNDDLRLLGFEVLEAGKVDLAAFESGLGDFLADGLPAIFYAPRNHFPYWVEFMKRVNTVPEEYGLVHSFMVCGASADEVLMVDSTSPDHEFFSFTLPWDVLRAGYAKEPDRWFSECMTLRKASEPDMDGFEAAYRAFLAGFRDGFELYDAIADGLVAERTGEEVHYHPPGVNSMALLAGSRTLFSRFLAHTGHSARVRAAYDRIAQLAAVLSDRVISYQARRLEMDPALIRRGLVQLRQREGQAARLLLDEAADLPRLLPVSASVAAAGTPAASAPAAGWPLTTGRQA